MAATRRRRLIFHRRTRHWVVGLLVVAVGALLLWFGLQWERDGTDVVDATAPAAGGDMVPPVDEGADVSPQPARSDHTTTTDVIPPEEP
jgi:hypothetical protein